MIRAAVADTAARLAAARLAGAAALLLLPQSWAAAAAPPDAPADRLRNWREVIVAAIRNCPPPKGDEIVVCAKDVGEAPPAYRYPRLTARYGGDAEDARRLPVRPGSAAGAAGVGSCSTVGAGGTTGCEVGIADRWKQGQLRDRAADGRP